MNFAEMISAKSFSIKDWSALQFFFFTRRIGSKVHLLETSVYEMTLFQLETGIYYIRVWTQTPWTWAAREMHKKKVPAIRIQVKCVLTFNLGNMLLFAPEILWYDARRNQGLFRISNGDEISAMADNLYYLVE